MHPSTNDFTHPSTNHLSYRPVNHSPNPPISAEVAQGSYSSSCSGYEGRQSRFGGRIAADKTADAVVETAGAVKADSEVELGRPKKQRSGRERVEVKAPGVGLRWTRLQGRQVLRSGGRQSCTEYLAPEPRWARLRGRGRGRCCSVGRDSNQEVSKCLYL